MEMSYKLNARELTHRFIDSIQNVYLDRDIEIVVRESEPPLDETEYLSRSPENRRRLDEAIKNCERGENLITFESLEQAIQCAREQAAR